MKKKNIHTYMVLALCFSFLSIMEIQAQYFEPKLLSDPFADKPALFSDIQYISNITISKKHKYKYRGGGNIPVESRNYQTSKTYSLYQYQREEKNPYNNIAIRGGSLNKTVSTIQKRFSESGGGSRIGIFTSNSTPVQSRIGTSYGINEPLSSELSNPDLGWLGDAANDPSSGLLPDLNNPNGSEWVGGINDINELPNLNDPKPGDWIGFADDAPIDSAYGYLLFMILCYISYITYRNRKREISQNSKIR